ncbi:MAG: SDR family NAD(P)-dependent oxidoreductase [Alphaproteobacteria bacterium]
MAARIDPKGRVALISGAGRGIGRAVAEKLHQEGYALSLGLRDPGQLADWAKGRENVLLHNYEARDRAIAGKWVDATVARFGRLDAIVANAGIVERFPFDQPDEDALDAMWDVNLKAPYRLIVAALPHLRRSGAGRIVTVVSLAGLRFGGGSPGYAMAKHATLALTQIARQFAWKDGVRATAICPGSTNTEFIAANRPGAPETLTQPEDLAEIVARVIALPNSASVAYVPVNYTAEAKY